MGNIVSSVSFLGHAIASQTALLETSVISNVADTIASSTRGGVVNDYAAQITAESSQTFSAGIYIGAYSTHVIASGLAIVRNSQFADSFEVTDLLKIGSTTNELTLLTFQYILDSGGDTISTADLTRSWPFIVRSLESLTNHELSIIDENTVPATTAVSTFKEIRDLYFKILRAGTQKEAATLLYNSMEMGCFQFILFLYNLIKTTTDYNDDSGIVYNSGSGSYSGDIHDLILYAFREFPKGDAGYKKIWSTTELRDTSILLSGIYADTLEGVNVLDSDDYVGFSENLSYVDDFTIAVHYTQLAISTDTNDQTFFWGYSMVVRYDYSASSFVLTTFSILTPNTFPVVGTFNQSRPITGDEGIMILSLERHTNPLGGTYNYWTLTWHSCIDQNNNWSSTVDYDATANVETNLILIGSNYFYARVKTVGYWKQKYQ